MKNVFQNYHRQKLKQKELIIILNKKSMNFNKWREKAKYYPNVKVYRFPESVSVGECMNFGVQKSRYGYIAKFDDDDYYGPFYLQTAWRVLKAHPTADIIGKSTFYYYFKKDKRLGLFNSQSENRFVSLVADATLIFKKEIIKHVHFSAMKKGTYQRFQKDCKKKGYKVYSTDRFHFAAIRSGKPSDHTWKIQDQQLLRYCTNVVYTNDFPSSVDKTH